MVSPGQDIYTIAERFRAELLRRERQAATELVRAYGAAWQRIKGRLDGLAEQIALARQRGEEVSPAWLLQQNRLQTIQRHVEAEIATFAQHAEAWVQAEQYEAVDAAQEHAERLVRAGLGDPPPGVNYTFARLPAGAVRDLVGFLQDGSPLRELLDDLGPDASQAVRQALITGVATGQHPTVIARQVRAALGGNLVRALTIARTEVLRAYRESSRRAYDANSDVVRGWVWHSAANRRTCAFCWSMHGTIHSLDERMATHPRCRCTMVPMARSWESMGYEVGGTGTGKRRRTAREADATSLTGVGTELFEKLTDDQQLAILGPAKFKAYKEGDLTLEDLRGFRRDPRWGMVGFERSLAAIRAGEGVDTLRLSPLRWRIEALNARFGRWSLTRAQGLAADFEQRFEVFARQLSQHLGSGGMRFQPLSPALIREASVELGFNYRYSEVLQLLAEARALTRWHLLNRYQRDTVFVMRGIYTQFDLAMARASMTPVTFPTSTTTNPHTAIVKFGGRYGTTYLIEAPVDDILYCYEISEKMQRAFPGEDEFILRLGALPEVLDAGPEEALRLRYNGPGRNPSKRRK